VEYALCSVFEGGVSSKNTSSFFSDLKKKNSLIKIDIANMRNIADKK
jgi:hypothetical protein